jgi:hypothetical protein
MIVIAGLSIAGCDGSPACSNGCWQPTPAEQSFISSFCALSVACCTSGGFPSAQSETNCLSAFQRNGVSADPSLQVACLSEMQARAGATLCEPDEGDLSDPCLRVVYEPSGPQQPGSQCVSRDDCAGAPGMITDCAPYSPSGICVRMAPGKAGDHTCLGDALPDGLSTGTFKIGFHEGIVTSGVLCARSDGLYCAQTLDAATSVCAPLVAAGAPCFSDAACESGTCLDAGALMGGTCAQKVSVGASCLAGAVCDDASYCAQTADSTSVCMARTSTGSSCTADDQCVSGYCGSDHLCSAETASQLGSVDAFCLGAL